MKTLVLWCSLAINIVLAGLMAWVFVAPYHFANTFLGMNVGVNATYEQLRSHFADIQHGVGGVVFLGDSITDGGRWAELYPGLSIRNMGIPGDTVAGVLDRLEQVTALRPRLVMLMIGTNDLGAGKAAPEVVEGVGRILAGLREQSPQTRVVLQSVLPRSRDYADRVAATNQGLRRVAQQFGAEYLDLHTRFADENGAIRREFTNDDLHLLGSGYRVWGQAIAGFMADP